MEKVYAAGAIIFRKEKAGTLYLLVFSGRNGIWGFPKGHIEPGEDEKTAAVREIFEETGIREFRWVEDFRKEDVYVIPRGSGEMIEKHSIYYLAETKAPEVRVDGEEITGYRWTTREEAWGLLSFDDMRTILTEADGFISFSKPR